MSFLHVRVEHTFRSGFRLNAEFTAELGVTALSGPSGSGKTSLLHAIAGLFTPARGEIRLNNRALTDTGQRIDLPPERRNVGIVFQDHCLFPHLTVRQNLEYGLRRHSRRSVEFERVLRTLQIESLVSRMPRNLSGGEKQRVALGRALLASPELLLLDEPFAGLDEPLQDKLVEFLRTTLAEFAIPTILVSHDQRHLSALAERVIRIKNGTVAQASPG